MRTLYELQRRLRGKVLRHERTAHQLKSEIVLNELRFMLELADKAVVEWQEHQKEAVEDERDHSAEVAAYVNAMAIEHDLVVSNLRKKVADLRVQIDLTQKHNRSHARDDS